MLQRRSNRSMKRPKQPASRSQRRKPQARAPRVRRSQVPAAFGMNTSSYARLKSGRDGSTTLESFEIFPITSSSSGLSYMIPMTPTKWIGTRTQTLSSTFSQSRPLDCQVGWEPAVSTGTAGSVAIGTVWSGARLPNDGNSWSSLSRVLAATNGGFICTIWDHHHSAISCGRNLRANGFPLYEVQPDDIPFWVCVASSDTSGAVIGYLTIRIRMTLRNPTYGATSPPVTAASMGTFTHDAENNSTTLTVAQGAFNKALSIGQDLLLAFGSNLINTASTVLSQILSPVRASLTEVAGGEYKFKVDSNFATQQALTYVIGIASNF